MSEQVRIDDGGPAFPQNEGYVRDIDHSDRGYEVGEPRYVPIAAHPGMSLRDWFAGQAMAGFVAHEYAPAPPGSYRGTTGENPDAWAEMAETDIAERCYRIADAMLRVGKAVQS